MILKLATAPSAEPLSVSLVKLWLKLDSMAEDSLFDNLIASARAMCEEFTRRSFITSVWDLWLDRFPPYSRGIWFDGVVQSHYNTLMITSGVIRIPRPPLISITHIKTYNTSNIEATFAAASYLADVYSEPGRVALNDGYSWPTELRLTNAINVRFSAGYGATAGDVPAPIKQAMLLVVAQLYEDRGDGAAQELPKKAKELLSPYVVPMLEDPNK